MREPASPSQDGHEATKPSAEGLNDLQSHEQSQLLDIIDQLRRQNLDADINIPQIVVCGDTSSGKSSVLEAIGQIRFPVGHKAVTKLPIEMVLRHSETTSMSVKIVPAQDRSERQKTTIRKYCFKADMTDHHRLDNIVVEAEAFLASIEEEGAEFWSDLLSAEVSGPTLPHLTLVDLPGLIHFSQSEGSRGNVNEDGMRIQKLTLDYLRNPRAVVLAVVSAINDTRNQEILSSVKKTNAYDRTLGIITKPDRVSTAKDEQQSLLSLARNQEIRLGLGWHVLRNLAHDEAETQRKDRDEIEQKFFSATLWTDVPSENLGIGSLRKKLSKCLFNCIKRDLPTLLEDMQHQAGWCTQQLERLGEGRETPQKQREYLSTTLQHLQRLIEAALEGQYSRSEFLTFFDGTEDKHLRDVIREQSHEFASQLRKNGKQFHIVKELFHGFSTTQLTAPSLLFVPPYVNGSRTAEAQTIGAETYCSALAQHMRARRGKLLKSHPSEAVQDIFRQQSVQWEWIARSYETACFSAVADFVRMAVSHVAGQYTANRLFEHHIDSELDRRDGLLRSKVADLLWPYQAAHPITYHPTFDERTVQGSADSFVEKLKDREDLLEAACALDQAEAYYDIAVNTFIENMATLAIERWLLYDLSALMPSDKVLTMTDDEITAAAAEPEESQSQRKRLASQIAVLEKAIRICRRHARQIGSKSATSLERPQYSANSRPQPNEQSETFDKTRQQNPQVLTPDSTPQKRRPQRRAAATPSSEAGDGSEKLAPDYDRRTASPSPSGSLRSDLFFSKMRRASSYGASTPESDEDL